MPRRAGTEDLTKSSCIEAGMHHRHIDGVPDDDSAMMQLVHVQAIGAVQPWAEAVQLWEAGAKRPEGQLSDPGVRAAEAAYDMALPGGAPFLELNPDDVQMFETQVLGEGASGVVIKGKLKVRGCEEGGWEVQFAMEAQLSFVSWEHDPSIII